MGKHEAKARPAFDGTELYLEFDSEDEAEEFAADLNRSSWGMRLTDQFHVEEVPGEVG